MRVGSLRSVAKRVVPTADVNPHDNFLWGLSLRVSFVVFAFVLF